jgi:hypothetical protein
MIFCDMNFANCAGFSVANERGRRSFSYSMPHASVIDALRPF